MSTKSAIQIAKEIERGYRKHRKQLESSMKETSPGSRAHLDHIAALAANERKHRDELSERGLIPQNLGTVMQTRYVFRAFIESAPVNETAADQAARAALDEEYGMTERPTSTPEVESTKPQSKHG